jgi:SM-20-related protein
MVHPAPQSAPQGETAQFDLYIVEQFISARTCRALIEEMRRSPASAATTYGKGDVAVDERVRRTRRVSPSTESVLFVTRRLEEHRENLERHFGIELRDCEEPQFLCYQPGDFFVAHQDGNTGLLNLDSDRTRRVSISIFLNEQATQDHADTYGGGALVFSDWRNGSRHEFAGAAGNLIAFRSETTHEVMPVTHGERYVIVSWFGARGNY